MSNVIQMFNDSQQRVAISRIQRHESFARLQNRVAEVNEVMESVEPLPTPRKVSVLDKFLDFIKVSDYMDVPETMR